MGSKSDDYCSYNRNDLRHRDTGESQINREIEIGVMHLQPKNAKDLWSHRSQKGSMKQILPESLQKEPILRDLDLRFLTSRTVRKLLSAALASHSWSCVTAALGNQYTEEDREMVHVTSAHIH